MCLFSLAQVSGTLVPMKLIELNQQLCQELDPQVASNAQAWLETPGSLTLLLQQTAAPKVLHHHLSALGWMTAGAQEQAIWPGFSMGQRIWQREISFSVDEVCWLRARVLIPESSLVGAAGVALQYCGAQSLGGVLFQDETLSRTALGYGLECSPEGICVTRHGLYTFYSQPLVISECFSKALWQCPLPKGGA